MYYSPNLNTVYINERLKKRLDSILASPITTLTAPAAYGKTTAIHWWEKNLAQRQAEAIILHQLIFNDNLMDFWEGLCKSLARFPDLADQMLALGYPENPRQISIFADILAETFSTINLLPTYLIIDDIHLIQQRPLIDLLFSLARILPETLHLVLLSRNQIFTEEQKLLLGNQLCEITAGDLLLKENELQAFALACELPASQEDLQTLYEITEGWISAIYLNFKSYAQSGAWLYHKESILSLVDSVLFEPLPKDCRELLLLLSMTEEFTKEQAAYLWPGEDLEDLLELLEKNNGFILKNDSHSYHCHRILFRCARQKFEERPESYQKDSYTKLGHWYISTKEYQRAYAIFHKAGDWHGIMQTLEEDRFANFNEAYVRNIRRRFQECPEEILRQYPMALVRCMPKMFVCNDLTLLKQAKVLLLESLEQNQKLTPREKNYLLGTAEVFESLLSFNDITAMSTRQRRAKSLLGDCLLQIDPKTAWTFAAPSVFMLYHRSVGRADEESKEMAECMPHYYDLSGGHGSGAEHLFQAELYYERGQLVDAEIANHMAMRQAEEYQQHSILLNCRILSMRIAIFRGEWSVIEECRDHCRKMLLAEKQYPLAHTLDVALAYIYALLDRPEAAAEWILKEGISETSLMSPALAVFYTFYNQLLLAQQDWVQVLIRREECQRIYTHYTHVACQIYHHIQLAAALEKLDKQAEALDELSIAFHMAMPDGIRMPFVENVDHLAPLLEELSRQEAYREAIHEITILAREYQRGKQQILWGYWDEHQRYGLSERELEIAKLAAARKSNLEIADALHLAPGTVRNHLSCIFAKLNITGTVKNKRRALEEILGDQTQTSLPEYWMDQGEKRVERRKKDRRKNK